MENEIDRLRAEDAERRGVGNPKGSQPPKTSSQAVGAGLTLVPTHRRIKMDAPKPDEANFLANGPKHPYPMEQEMKHHSYNGDRRKKNCWFYLPRRDGNGPILFGAIVSLAVLAAAFAMLLIYG
jgi:hypothetical protein